jgi:hypothetical protein
MIKACVIFNYNSYYRINLSDNLKLRTLFQTLPHIVCRKPREVLYIICNGQIIGSNPAILDHSLNMIGLAEGRCTIHIIFKIPNETYTYTHNDLLASYNAFNYPETDTGRSDDIAVELSQQANRIIIEAMMNTVSFNPDALEPNTVVANNERIAEVLVDATDPNIIHGLTCVICSQTEGGTWVRLLTCGHTFHRECITDWLSMFSTKCPVCDSDVR